MDRLATDVNVPLDNVPPVITLDTSVCVGLDVPDTVPPVIAILLRVNRPESTATAETADGIAVNVPLITADNPDATSIK